MLYESAEVHACYGKPAKPTVDEDFVGPTYGQGQVLVYPSFRQAAVQMKGIQIVLDSEKCLEHRTLLLPGLAKR